MGMIYLAIKIPSFYSIAFIGNIFAQLKLMMLCALTHLGLFKPPPSEEPTRDYLNGFVLIVDSQSPSLVPISVHVVTAAIKRRVPICPYGDFLDRLAAAVEREKGEDGYGYGYGVVKGGGEKVCTVCWEGVERQDKIRELYNCDHVFHVECLDTWVSAGHVTCPLCRALLLPPKNMSSRFDHADGRSFRQRPISRVY